MQWNNKQQWEKVISNCINNVNGRSQTQNRTPILFIYVKHKQTKLTYAIRDQNIDYCAGGRKKNGVSDRENEACFWVLGIFCFLILILHS